MKKAPFSCVPTPQIFPYHHPYEVPSPSPSACPPIDIVKLKEVFFLSQYLS